MLASHLWNNFLFLTHSSWAFSWVSCMGFYHFNIIIIHFYWLLLPDSVVGFPALVFCILWKPVIWLLLRFNWLVVTRCTTGYGESWNRLQTATGLEPRTTLVINKYSTVWPNWPKATTECGFTLKRVHDMIRTYSQTHPTDKYSEHSSIIWSVWPNVFIIFLAVFLTKIKNFGKMLQWKSVLLKCLIKIKRSNKIKHPFRNEIPYFL